MQSQIEECYEIPRAASCAWLPAEPVRKGSSNETPSCSFAYAFAKAFALRASRCG